MNRRLRGLVPASLAVALLTLAACGSDQPGAEGTASPAPTTAVSPEASDSPAATPAPPVTPSTNLDAVTVEGAPEQKPTVTVPAPWAIDETRTRVLIPGDGTTVAEGGTVEVQYVGVNARTGKVFDDSWSRGEPASFPLAGVVPGFGKGLTDQQVGSRVLIAMPGPDGYDSSGGNPQIDIQVGDTLIFVVDVLSTSLKAAEGDAVQPREGLPTVVFEGDRPRVTVPPNTSAPTELIVQPLIRGRGKPVQPTDEITAVYQAVVWKDGQVVEDTYGKDPETSPLAQLIPAWQEGLRDQPVGSRVLLVAPPDKAYPNDPGARSPNPAVGETLVYVVDILYATAGQ